MGNLKALGATAAILLCGCTPSPPAPTTMADSAARPTTDSNSVTRRLQNSRHRCLEQSYRVTRTQTPDKNAAAEMAFQACSSEERDLALSTLFQPSDAASEGRNKVHSRRRRPLTDLPGIESPCDVERQSRAMLGWCRRDRSRLLASTSLDRSDLAYRSNRSRPYAAAINKSWSSPND
jgi:hypothetical protein